MKKVNADTVRTNFTNHLQEALERWGYDTLPVEGGYSVPVVAPDGEEGYVTVSVVVRGKNREGLEYDGYDDSAMYQEEQLEKAHLAKAKAQEKERKQALRDAKKAEKERAKALQPTPE